MRVRGCTFAPRLLAADWAIEYARSSMYTILDTWYGYVCIRDLRIRAGRYVFAITKRQKPENHTIPAFFSISCSAKLISLSFAYRFYVNISFLSHSQLVSCDELDRSIILTRCTYDGMNVRKIWKTKYSWKWKVETKELECRRGAAFVSHNRPIPNY